MKNFNLKALAVATGATIAMFSVTPSYAEFAPEGFADLVEQISPSVVNITTNIVVPAGSQGQIPELPPGLPDFFRDLLENNPNFGQQGQREGMALGSGYIIDEDGYIVTNNHVVENADTVTIETYDNKEILATVVGTDPKTDVALLKVETDVPLQATSFGDSDEVRVGDWVVAVGNPLGQGFSVSAGVVSARNRSLEGSYDDYIQTDAAINRGNSGGPLFDLDGKVIGMNTAILSPNGGSIGIGFAMSSRVVSQVVEQLKEYGETRRGWLGVSILDVNEEIAHAMDLKEVRGAIVMQIPEGPAKDAGIQQGDVILEFDGEKIDDVRELVNVVGNSEIGKTVDVEIYRQGEGEQTLKVTLGRLEDNSTQVATSDNDPTDLGTDEEAADVLGMTLVPLTEENAQVYGIETAGGLLVTEVTADSEASARAINPGDVIRTANRQAVNSVDALNSIIEQTKDEGRDSILLVVERAGNGMFIAMPVE